MNVLVTGATGFVGVNVTIALAEQGHDVVALHRSHFSGSLLEDLRSPRTGRVTFVQEDATDHAAMARVFTQHAPSHVVHAAAVTPSPEQERAEPWSIIVANELSTLAVLAASATQAVERVVYVSSAAVYDGSVEPRPPLTAETAALAEPGTLYALTKIASERLCRWAGKQFGVDVRAVRPTNIYGPFERPTPSRQTMSSLYLALHLACSGTTISANGRSVVRDWVHAGDVARAIVLLLGSRQLNHHAYNVTGEAVTTEHLLDAIAAKVPGSTVDWVESSAEANVPVFTDRVPAPIDISRLHADTGFEPRYSVIEGITAYATWLGDRHMK